MTVDLYCTVRTYRGVYIMSVVLEKREAKQTKMGRSELRSDQLHMREEGKQ